MSVVIEVLMTPPLRPARRQLLELQASENTARPSIQKTEYLECGIQTDDTIKIDKLNLKKT